MQTSVFQPDWSAFLSHEFCLSSPSLSFQALIEKVNILR